MRRVCKSAFWISVFLLIFSGCSRPPEIPLQESALEQFYYAMENFYFPAEHAAGSAREKLMTHAIEAFERVLTFGLDNIDPLVLMEVYFYKGICQKNLDQPEQAMESFYQCFSADVPGAAVDDYDADMISYKNDAWYALMELRQYLTPEYLNAVDLYRPDE